jgi:DNA end-binding protein Ku
MPRAIWSGSISFGLVNVPVRMYAAIDEQDLRFHLVHEKDGGRIGYEKICKREDKPVPDKEIVKAYELHEDEFVYLDDEDFEAAKSGGFKSIEIKQFVRYEEIDPIFFERSFYLGPAQGGEKVYALLAKAMAESELAAIATYVMREREHLGCLRATNGVITLAKMYFADEIRPVDEIRPKGTRVDKAELEMAAELIDSFTGTFKPEQHEDTYRAALLKVVRAKAKGKTVKAPEPAEEEEPVDLMEALRASVKAAGGGKKRARPQRRRPRAKAA